MNSDLTTAVFHESKYRAGLAGLRASCIGQELTLECIVSHGLNGGIPVDDIREELLGVGIDSESIQEALDKGITSTAQNDSYSANQNAVHNYIAAGGHQHPLADLVKQSPVTIPSTIRAQRRAFGHILFLDWRCSNPADNPCNITASLNQRADDKRWLAHLRYCFLVFPFLSLFEQTAFWLGLLSAHSQPVRLIEYVHDSRFNLHQLKGVIRLNECDRRVLSKLQPGQPIYEGPLVDEDFACHQQQCDALRRDFQSDPNSKFRCLESGLDPLASIELPGNDDNGMTARIVWLGKPDFENDQLF